MTKPTWADCAGALSGPGRFGSHLGDANDELAFDAAIDGPFVLSPQSGKGFSPFYIDGDGTPISSIDFAALDVSVHRNAAGNSLSRSSIYGAQPLPAIPEPHTSLLMLAGLAAIGFMATRRRRP
jgi:hypothetical protein